MSNLYIPQFDVGDTACELFWLAGLSRDDRNAWFVQAVLKDTIDAFYMKLLPIGLLPVLTLGQVFMKGRQLPLSTLGTTGSVRISDVSCYREITSAQIPSALYSFGNAVTGTQRLFRYQAGELEIYIPVIELIRYLFLHNRTLANALMRPSALMTLFSPEVPGYYPELLIQFTKDMPKSALSNKIVQEFAWLAIDPDARRSWDSVCEKSNNQKYMSFVPPPIANSDWRFRGIKSGNQWLILELLHMSGRKQPCEKLIYSHPSFKKSIVIEMGSGKPITHGDPDDGLGDKKTEKTVYDYQLDDGQEGSKPADNPKSLKPMTKISSFDKEIEIKKLYEDVEHPANEKGKGCTNSITIETKKTVRVSAGEFSAVGELPPIEFKILLQASPDHIGDLEVSAAVMQQLSNFMPSNQISMSLCYLKSGRAFSMSNRLPRVALITKIKPPMDPSIVLIDIEKTGVVALSLLALRFFVDLPIDELERVLQSILDGLVESNGHWSREVENKLKNICVIDRLPRIFSPRDKSEKADQTKVWAAKLTWKLFPKQMEEEHSNICRN